MSKEHSTADTKTPVFFSSNLEYIFIQVADDLRTWKVSSNPSKFAQAK